MMLIRQRKSMSLEPLWQLLCEILSTQTTLINKLQSVVGVAELAPILEQAKGGPQQWERLRQRTMDYFSGLPPFLAQSKSFLNCLAGIHNVPFLFWVFFFFQMRDFSFFFPRLIYFSLFRLAPRSVSTSGTFFLCCLENSPRI